MMIERTVYRSIDRIGDPALRRAAESLARLILENWFYGLVVVLLWLFPNIVADLSGSEVTPRRPTGESTFWQSEMARALVLACLAMSYNLLFGYNGIISFGHALFFGAGGYITFILLARVDRSYQQEALVLVLAVVLALAIFARPNVRRLVTLAVGGVLLVLLLVPSAPSMTFYQAAALAVLGSAGLSLLSGVVTLRLRGIYFTMFTLALAEMFFVLVKSGTFRNITGAEDGLGFGDLLPDALNPTPTGDGSRLQMYRLTIVFFVIVFLAIRRYLNSPVGRVIVAIRENEERARTIGYNTFFYKLLTMMFAGVIATLSGVLFVIWATDKRVHPELLSLKFTVDPLLHTLIGGVGTLTGPVVAALGLSLGETYLRNETFTLETGVLGLMAMWQFAVALVVALLVLFLRRALRPAIHRLVGEGGRWSVVGAYLGLWIALSAAALLIGGQIVPDLELRDETLNVSDLWDLFLGIVFVVVVMLLPHGIVGTWNRFWITRRVRRMERALQREKVP